MKYQSNVTNIILILILTLSIAGCKVFSTLVAEQQWSSNYALEDGVRASDPAFIDGDLKTMGKSQFPQESPQGFQFPLSEAIVDLPEKKSIHRIVIHSPNLQVFDVMARDEAGSWNKIKEFKGNKEGVIDARISVVTDGIKLRVRRTTDDATERRKHRRRTRDWIIIDGNLRASAEIKEIELYGFMDKGAKKISTESKTTNEENLEELLDDQSRFPKSN